MMIYWNKRVYCRERISNYSLISADYRDRHKAGHLHDIDAWFALPDEIEQIK